MKELITIKEVVEHYFDKRIPLTRLYDIQNQRNYLKRTIESYNPDTGHFMISGCKKVFNVNSHYSAEIEIESRSEGWADFVCQHYFGKTFEQIQNHIEHEVLCNDNVEYVNSGGSWMKYANSCPKTVNLTINDIEVFAVKTYSTITNIELIGLYQCGGIYSNTSTRWAYDAGFGSRSYCFRAN